MLPKEVMGLYKELIIKNKDLLKVTIVKNGKEEKIKISDLSRGPQSIVMASILNSSKHI